MRTLLLLTVLATGCMTHRLKRLSPTEYDHYSALKVYMDDGVRKDFLKLKTEEERNQYLKDAGLWDKFYQYDEHIREKILSYEVLVGWTKDMLYMSWGKPYDKRKLAGRHAERSELLVYRFEQHENGDIYVWEPGSKTAYAATSFFTREVTLDDDRIAEVGDPKPASW